jgi:glycosyltransferase involved in cell wall biosynthesis
MRILVLQDYLRCGGTEHQSVFLGESFARGGHEVHLITFRPGGVLGGRLHGSAVRWRALQPIDLRMNFLAPGLFHEVARIAPDVILCMGKMANCCAGFLQKRFSRISVVASVRSGKGISPIELWSCRIAGAVITNSDWWRWRLIRRGVDAAKIHLVRNALVHEWNLRARAATRNRARRDMGAGPDTVVFVNVAAFRSGKRQRLLIELCSHLGHAVDWQLWLVGDGRERRRCQRFAHLCGVAHRMRFINYTENPFEYYAGADVAVSASVEDALPNFVVEAQCMGLPVAATDYRGVSEAMVPGKTGLLAPPQDQERFLAQMQRLGADAALRARMGRAAGRFARKQFAPNRQAARTLEILTGMREGRAVIAGDETMRPSGVRASLP